MKRIRVLAVLLLLLPLATQLNAKNIFQQLLDGYAKYQTANMILWLLGDTGAEKRFGDDYNTFLMLTNKEEKDPKLNAWAKGIFSRLVVNTPDRKLPYRLTLLRGDTHNAFAIPGGRIYIYSGMLKFLESDDEVAAVLGHELAHAWRRHMLHALRRDTVFTLAIEKLAKQGSKEELLAYAGMVFEHFRFSRQNEFEADRLGIEGIKKAGFNPAAGIYLWEKMLKKYGSTKGGDLAKWLSTHPPSEDRISAMRKQLKEMGAPEEYTFRHTHFTKEKSPESAKIGAFDGSFEQDADKNDLPDGLFFLTPNLVLDKTVAHSGKQSIRFKPNPFGYEDKLSTDFLPVDTKKTYLLAAYLKSDDADRRVTLGVEVYDAKKQLLGTLQPLKRAEVATDWRRYLAQVNGPRDSEKFPTGATHIRVILVVSGSAKGSLWLDDLDFRAVEAKDGVPIDLKGDFDELLAGVTRPPDWRASLNATLDTKEFYRGRASFRLDPITGNVPTYIETPNFPVDLGDHIRIRFTHRSTQPMKTRVSLVVLDPSDNRLLPAREKEVAFEINSNMVWAPEDHSFNLETLGYPAGQAHHAYIRFENTVAAGNHFWLDEFQLSKVFGVARPNRTVRNNVKRDRSRPATSRFTDLETNEEE